VREAPYKVVVWGPGIVGKILLREILPRPELELVGVLAYSPEKDGVDVGTLLGVDPVGVKVTTNKDDVLDMGADCVLFCTRVTAGADPDSETTADLCRLLEHGINVVTPIGYHYPAFHGEAFAQRLEDACRKGGASLHSTGINPGLLSERFLTTLSAVCTSIDSIVVQEMGDGNIDSPDMMAALGLGQPPGAPAAEVIELATRYYSESITYVCKMFGRQVERIESEFDYVVADRDYPLIVTTVKKGTMGGVIHKFTAIVDGKPFFRLEEVFLADIELSPVPLTSQDHWTITIEGKPTSIRASIDMKPSFAGGGRYRPGDDTIPAYYATGVPVIQAIPVVCSAPPGIVYPSVFSHCVPDWRMLDSTPG
jgi:4-hydroxy-tetrahydrodipicolinate reductase